MARTGDESDPTDILVGDETGPAAFVDEDAKNSEELEKRLRMCNLRKSTYLACVTSMVLYSADVLSDIFVGVKYLASKQWDYAAMTFGFFILATFLCNFTAPAPAWKTVKERTCLFWVWIGPYFFFNVEPVVQYVYNIGHVRGFLQSRRDGDAEGQIKKHDDYIKGYGKIADMKHKEALWEAAPQVVVQVYFLICGSFLDSVPDGTSEYFILRLLRYSLNLFVSVILQLSSIFFSVIGMISTQYSYHKAHYIARGECVSFFGASLMTLGYTIPLVCRCVTISTLLYTNYLACLLFLLVHWLISVACWYRCGWGGDGVTSLLVDGLRFTLQPSYRTKLQCAVTNLALFVEEAVVLEAWNFFGRGERLSDPLGLIIVDVVFRTVNVVHWMCKRRFVTKVFDVSPDETDM